MCLEILRYKLRKVKFSTKNSYAWKLMPAFTCRDPTLHFPCTSATWQVYQWQTEMEVAVQCTFLRVWFLPHPESNMFSFGRCLGKAGEQKLGPPSSSPSPFISPPTFFSSSVLTTNPISTEFRAHCKIHYQTYIPFGLTSLSTGVLFHAYHF